MMGLQGTVVPEVYYEKAKTALETLKKDLKESVVCALDVHVPFEVETDASSEFAIAATLNKKGCPVAFFSHTLQGPEVRHASAEKVAQAIIKTICHLKHYLTGRYFLIKTDQCSVAYMFNNKQRGKIKKDKIMRWSVNLFCYNFDIVYHHGAESIAPDTFSQSFCAAYHLVLI